MNEFLGGLSQLLLQFRIITIQENQYAHLVFAVGCGVMGVLMVVTDISFFLIRGESLLKLRHSPTNTPVLVLFWFLGSSVIGYFGQVLNIFQVSLLACATVGVTWPIIFKEILERTKRREDIQRPAQEE